MHYVYILKSEDTGKYYIGETTDVERRLLEHQAGKSSFGRRNKGVALIYKKEFNTRGNARAIESFLKRQKSHSFIDRLIAGKISLPCSSVGRARGCQYGSSYEKS